MQTNNSAKFVFFYMLSLVTLIFMSLSSGMIVFQIINKFIVDAMNIYSGVYDPDALKFAISALIISTPIFYLCAREINKNLFSGELEKDSGIRKWLTYFILFISSVVMIGWLIGTINTFLNGDLTLKFALKAITSIGIAVAIFSYYFYDIRREKTEKIKDAVVQSYFYISLGAVLIILISSFLVVESPAETRTRKNDEAVIQKLTSINNEVNNFYNTDKKLPVDLNALLQRATYLTKEDFKNSASGENFVYKITGDNAYQLCATFLLSNKAAAAPYSYPDMSWKHDAGYQCLPFKVVVDAGVKGVVPTVVPVQ
jgi:hypothetical protein